MLSLLVSILVVCIVFALVWWILSVIPLPQPIAQIVRVVCVVIMCIWLIYVLLGLTGAAGLGFHRY
jgi:hypothetical protein